MRTAVYRQFCLDAGRMGIAINGERDEDMPERCLYTLMVNMFRDERKGLWFVYWCTQTALASVYHAKASELNQDTCRTRRRQNSTTAGTPADDGECFTYHLLDDGRQQVSIHVSDADAEEAELSLHKPFRVGVFDEGHSLETVCYYQLHVKVTTRALGSSEVTWLRHGCDTVATRISYQNKTKQNQTNQNPRESGCQTYI
jgi:hypothetical protein